MVAGALPEYFERTGAKIDSVHLVDFSFGLRNTATSIFLEGLTRSASVKEVISESCRQDDDAPQDVAQQLANFIRKKSNLESLCISSCAFFTDAVVEGLLIRRDSLLRFLGVEVCQIFSGILPVANVRAHDRNYSNSHMKKPAVGLSKTIDIVYL